MKFDKPAGWGFLAYELVIFAMRTDPEPMHTTCYGNTQCAVVETDANAMKASICNGLEMQ